MDGKSLSKQQRIDQHGEVFTPDACVKLALDLFPVEMWYDKNQKWIDNTCGEGAFLVEVKNRLMLTLVNDFPDEKDREQYILDKLIFGIELQEDNCQKCRRNLGLNEDGSNGHIICADALKYHYRFDELDTEATKDGFIWLTKK